MSTASNESTLRAVELRGRAYLDAATALLVAARGDDPLAGSYEAGDIQWWWATAQEPAASRGAFWYDRDAAADAAPVAALIVTDKAGAGDAGGAIDLDVIRRPAAGGAVRAAALAAVAARFAAYPGRTLRIAADEPDEDLRRLLEGAGFRRDPDEDLLQLWQRPAAAPAPLPLPVGFRFDDERSRPADRPHHLAKRNGARVAELLRETSLYRPDLDLCVRAEDGTVAAYCLCWLHPTTGVGLFEPVRTEDAFQRRGLGRALLTEGIRRMVAAGADLIKVTCEQGNPAACSLYEGVGFAPGFAMLGYVRP